MATRFRLNFEQIFGTSAQVLAGGTLTFAISGGAPDQLQAIYSDDALTVTKLNPVTLDSAGKHGDIFLLPLDYRVILKDAAGIVQPGGDVDPIHGAIGAGDVTFIQDGTGAVSRSGLDKLRESVSVKDFGAVGDGVADDAAAFQAAINYCQDNLKALRIPGNNPSATYKIGATLFVTKPIVMRGDGKYIVTLQGAGLAAGAFVLDVDGTAFGTFGNAAIGGFTLMADGVPHLMRVKNASESQFYDIGLRGGVKGIIYTGTRCFSNVFDGISTISPGASNHAIAMEAHTGGGHHSFRGCVLSGDTGLFIDTNTITDGVVFYNCNFEQGISNSFYCGGTVHGLAFFGCRTEGCDGEDFQINPAAGQTVTGVVISGCCFNASDAGSVARISLGGAGGSVRGFSITGNAVDHAASNFVADFVKLNGDGESGTIANNFLNGPKAGCRPVNIRRSHIALYGNEAKDGKFPGTLDVDGPTAWTPADTSGAGLGLTVAVANYIRTGAVVQGQIQAAWPATANAAGAKIGPLPYADADAGGPDRAGVTISLCTVAGVISAFRKGTNIELYKAGAVVATNADLSGASIYLSFYYTTTQP